jgi:ABC-type polysaccharide/polyol phosphate export permease
MIASGKMFVANALPASMRALFDWNPLYHTIDQARGFAFINYNPMFSSISYALTVSVVLVMIGLMLEFYACRNVSLSHEATR